MVRTDECIGHRIDHEADPTDDDRSCYGALAVVFTLIGVDAVSVGLHLDHTEVPDPGALLRLVAAVLKPGGHFLRVEPKGHVRQAAFDQSVQTAEALGLTAIRAHPVAFSRGVLMARHGGPA